MDVTTDHPFQHFAEQIFSIEANAAILESLQKDYSININLLLFYCWAAQSGRGKLTKKQVRHTIAATYPWHEQIIQGLNQVNHKISQKTKKTLSALRNNVQQEIRTALQLEQLMLTESLPELIAKRRTMKQQLTHALKNIAAYGNELRVYFDKEDCAKLSQLFTTIFPKIEKTVIAKTCKEILLNKNFQEGSPRGQSCLML